jgi:hypothetical protein
VAHLLRLLAQLLGLLLVQPRIRVLLHVVVALLRPAVSE